MAAALCTAIEIRARSEEDKPGPMFFVPHGRRRIARPAQGMDDSASGSRSVMHPECPPISNDNWTGLTGTAYNTAMDSFGERALQGGADEGDKSRRNYSLSRSNEH